MIPYVFLFLFFLMLCLVLLWHGDWPHHASPCSSKGAVHALVQRLLRPRTPLDCPACCHSSTFSAGVGPSPLPVRPWREVKSRRGAPKRIHTEGFACPNRQCDYCGITDASIHALVGDGKHGQAERIQTFRGPACHTTFTARLHTPLYRLKTPSHQIAIVLTVLAEGLDPSAAERVFGYRQATITTWLTRSGKHAELFHERCFCNLHLPHLQLDELRTRLRRATQILWLWLAIDPFTKIIPVLQLGPRTQNMAHTVIHSLQRSLAPGCIPLFTSDGLNVYFYASRCSFWDLARRETSRAHCAPVAGGGRSDLWPGEEKLSTAQADLCDACNAPGDRGRSQSHLTGIRPFWTAQHRFY
jgi:transposase-like protein